MSDALETTQAGEQRLMSGVCPVTTRDGLKLRAAQLMRPKRNPHTPQKPCDHGLFDEVGRAQLDLTDLIAQTNQETNR